MPEGEAVMGRRAAGLTLLEVVISVAILGFITLIVLSATVPASWSSAETGLNLDMDRTAHRLLAQLRRDVRRSGYEGTTLHFGSTAVGTTTDLQASPGSTVLTLDQRTDVATWGSTVVWQLSGTDVLRTQHGLTVSMTDGRTTGAAGGVSSFRVVIPAGDRVCDVTLTLTRVNPKNGATVTRSYLDRVEMMNR